MTLSKTTADVLLQIADGQELTLRIGGVTIGEGREFICDHYFAQMLKNKGFIKNTTSATRWQITPFGLSELEQFKGGTK